VKDNPAYHRGYNLPVERVSHKDCLDFCERLSGRLQRGVRLPTEAEWEYACRGGTRTSFCSGEGVEALRLVGWCSYSGDWDGSGGTQEVGRLRCNSLGLFDMHGNVWEWCADWYTATPDEADAPQDPAGPASGEARVLRGGSWRGGPWFCRSAERRAIEPAACEINIGFRVAIDPG
jgi:formylglycine-generating enzyme required for sulfatase activity